MNWKQIHVSSTPEEQLEALTLMLRVLQARHNRRILLRGRLILERRRTQAAHWISDRRGRHAWSRVAIPLVFFLTLIIVSTATALLAIHAPIETTSPTLFFYLTSIWAVIAFRPHRQFARQNSENQP